MTLSMLLPVLASALIQTPPPPAPINLLYIYVGHMECSARLNSPTAVQVWCLTDGNLYFNALLPMIDPSGTSVSLYSTLDKTDLEISFAPDGANPAVMDWNYVLTRNAPVPPTPGTPTRFGTFAPFQ